MKADTYWEESVHTKLSYWFCVIAVGIELVLGLRHLKILFGQLCMIEFSFGLSGLLLSDLIHGQKTIYPKEFKHLHPNLFFRFVFTFGIIALIQFIFQIIPLITSTEMALAIVFCAVCEEYFFRCVLMEPFFRSGRNAEDKFRILKKDLSYIALFGILISSSLFMAFHVNYYYSKNLMLMVFVGGLWLGFCYWYWKDLTASILAHFLLNIIFVYQFYMVYL